MAIQVETRDCAALTDADLDDMASMGGAFDIGVLSKAKEDWVLCATARVEGKLHGFSFSTLERIGGTPCVLIGLLSVKRTSKRDQVLKSLMGESFHRALMMPSPARFTAESHFASAARPSLESSSRSGSQPAHETASPNTERARDGSRPSTVTASPRETSCLTRGRPMKPVAPATTMFMSQL